MGDPPLEMMRQRPTDLLVDGERSGTVGLLSDDVSVDDLKMFFRCASPSRASLELEEDYFRNVTPLMISILGAFLPNSVAKHP